MNIFGRLPEPFKWTVHNLFAHPVSEILHVLSYAYPRPIGKLLRSWSEKLHDKTVPK